MAQVKDELFLELCDQLERQIDAYGMHHVALAIMTIIDKKAEKTALTFQDAHWAKRWAACADAAVALEAVTLKELGE
jgi:hypothetical protein